jgi:hypothetical protein
VGEAARHAGVPTKLLFSEPGRTGVLVLTPDGKTVLYTAMYEGPLLTSIPSAVSSQRGVYLANLALGDRSRQQTGMVSLKCSFNDRLRPERPQTSSSPWSAIAGATGAGAPTRCPIVAVELP